MARGAQVRRAGSKGKMTRMRRKRSEHVNALTSTSQSNHKSPMENDLVLHHGLRNLVCVRKSGMCCCQCFVRESCWLHGRAHDDANLSCRVHFPPNLPTYLSACLCSFLPQPCLHTYIPIYLHTYLPTYILLPTFIPTYLHFSTYLPTYLPPHTCLPAFYSRQPLPRTLHSMQHGRQVWGIGRHISPRPHVAQMLYDQNQHLTLRSLQGQRVVGPTKPGMHGEGDVFVNGVTETENIKVKEVANVQIFDDDD